MLDGTNAYEPPESTEGIADVSEQDIRAFIKSQIPRLLRNGTRPFLVEEMEVCSGRARIDLAVITDGLIGIEIKGPKDDVSRLPGQAKAYSECFDHVVLVTHEALAAKAITLIPEWWGIVVGTRRGCRLRYRFLRRPQSNPNLNLEKLLTLLWRDEIDALQSELVGSTPSRRATKKTIRAELLSRIDPPVLRQASLQKLRHRTAWRWVPV
jgi:hypothetical protein